MLIQYSNRGGKKNIFRLLHANLLVNGLLEMLIVHNGSHFSITVGGPIGSGNFHTRFTGINSKAEKEKCIQFSVVSEASCKANIKSAN